MYRRPTLCTLHIAVDFLKSLEIAVVVSSQLAVVCANQLTAKEGSDLM